MTIKPCPLEDEEAVVFADWLRAKQYPFTHVGNESNGGTKSAMIRGAKMKRMGQSKGVFDYEIFVPVEGVTNGIDTYQEIRVELKRKFGGTVSSEQKAWKLVYEKSGIPCAICKGAEEAIKYVQQIEREIRGIV